MKVTDLRIGNLTLLEGRVTKINCLGTYLSGEDGYRIKAAKGIPLTEEWLVKFGFVNNGYNPKVFYNGEYYITKYNGADWDIFDDVPAACNSIGMLTLDTVHQLQNLYFALTGEELIIKG